jgi:hypothetical protein
MAGKKTTGAANETCHQLLRFNFSKLLTLFHHAGFRDAGGTGNDNVLVLYTNRYLHFGQVAMRSPEFSGNRNFVPS